MSPERPLDVMSGKRLEWSEVGPATMHCPNSSGTRETKRSSLCGTAYRHWKWSNALPTPHTIRKNADDAYLLLGRTDDGRMLLLVYQQKPRGVVRVYSGREMTTRERRAYRRQVDD